MTKVSSAVSTTEYTAFDILGRVTAAKQTTDGGDAAGYSTGYTYNLSGALIEETYPSGRKVKNVLDNDGELSLVQSARCGVVNGVTATCSDPQGYFSYAKSFTYNAAGAVTSMQLGNGRWETTQFNSRLQPTQIALGTVQNATDKLKLDYNYGTTANNGNVLSQKITVARSGQADMVFDQTYTYDPLNRLKMAEEKTGTTTNWKQTFVFDRYGNRNFDRANTTQPASFANPNVTDPSVDAANNRFTSGQGYTYDAAGNVISDAEGRTFTYDGENKQTEVRNSGSSTIGQYYFDGDGKRVKKIVPSTGETTVFVYDASGKLVAEYSTNVVPVQDAKVNYLTADHLGSPRINTDQYGAVIARHDYHPFGEEIFSAERTTILGYAADTIRKQFTGYERDNETDLDYAQARMYANHLGRFASCDPIYVTKSHITHPQRWNAYIYVFNNPLSRIDPDGRKPKVIDVYIAFEDYSTDQIKEIQEILRKAVDPKKFTVNVYGWKQSTADNVAESLRSKGRTVIIAGHINGGDGEETGELRSDGRPKTAANSIVLNGGLLRSDGIYVYGSEGLNRVNTERIRADSVFVFSCGLTPNAASQFAGRLTAGGTFVYSDGGDDTGTSIQTAMTYASYAATAVGQGMTVSETAGLLQGLSDMYETLGVKYQNGDNIIPCQSNGTCAEKRHKLAPK